MLITILSFIFGILGGIFTGLFPGIHINLISAILISLPLTSAQTSPLPIIIFIVSMAITHTFLDFIPSIYLGAPEEDSFLSILPGHELLQKGRGHEAVVLTLYGSLAAIPLILLFLPAFIFIIPKIYNLTKTIIPFILIFVSIYLILREDEFLLSATIFLLSGFLGYIALNSPINEPFLPLLTGLFGTSTLIISIGNKISLPKQKVSPLKKIKLPKKEFISSLTASIISAPISSFLPGIGSGQAAVIGSEIIPQTNRSFLFLVGAINTMIMGLSFVTLYSIERTRTGAAAAIGEITSLSLNNLLLIVIIILISGIISFILGIKISKISSKYITRISYSKLSVVIISILSLLTITLSGTRGFLILLTATSLGIFCILSRIKRINLMGSLLLPVILFYLF